MKINIYINGRPLAEYQPVELDGIKKELSAAAMKAADYIRKED